MPFGASRILEETIMNQATVSYTIPVYRLQLVQEGRATAMPVTGPAELASHLKEIAMADREHMVCVFLDTKNRAVARQVISIGTLNASLVHPREVFKAALLSNANSIILTHNHPSSEINPSTDDDEVTRRIARAGGLLNVPLLDHVILSPDGGFYSYRDHRPDCLQGGDAL